MRDQVEGDVEAAEVRRHGVRMGIDGILVERIGDSRLCRATGASNPFRNLFEPLERPSRQMHASAFAGERGGDRGPDRSAAAIDDDVPPLEQHCQTSLVASGWTGREPTHHELVMPGWSSATI